MTRYFFWKNRGSKNFPLFELIYCVEDKLKLLEDREKISKIEDSPLKNQADGQPINESKMQ